ncbi:MAG: hypothetical protein AAF614_02625 [Chloroflexota bacterium]
MKKSVEESIQELMAFCEQKQKRLEAETAVPAKGWRGSLQRAISVAYANVHSVLDNMSPKQQTPPKNKE